MESQLSDIVTTPDSPVKAFMHRMGWWSSVLIICCSVAWAATVGAEQYGDTSLLRHEMRRLNSDEHVVLAERYAGRPLLIVNTASRCGYTRQFEGLERLYQSYRERGLAVIGFSSNDFRQELDDESEAAQVCYVNYGVSFDMYAPIHVKGPDAHPLFQTLARQAEPPAWNFHKYLVDAQGRVVGSFPGRVRPGDERLISLIEGML